MFTLGHTARLKEREAPTAWLRLEKWERYCLRCQHTGFKADIPEKTRLA